VYEYDVSLGLPHTNHAGLAEHLLLMYAGNVHWTSIATAIGSPLSTLRTSGGGEVYAAFYFIEERFPAGMPISAFKLGDNLHFAVSLRAFKSIAVEGQIVFDHKDRLERTLAGITDRPLDDVAGQHPFIRFGSIFITPESGNSLLRVAPPANTDFSSIPPLPNEENPYQLVRAAQENDRLGVLDDAWICIDERPGFDATYAIDIDRDTNGAGLVYFANYVAFMDSAERLAMALNAEGRFCNADVVGRSIHRRRIAYYGNADVTDTIRTRVSLFVRVDDHRALGLRYAIHRERDGLLICRSEAIKFLPTPEEVQQRR
jgi:probable biosynthetic protein (TIGR04098 family)